MKPLLLKPLLLKPLLLKPLLLKSRGPLLLPLTLATLLGISGCAHQPPRLNPACPSTANGDETLLLGVTHNGSVEQLLLHTQIEGEQMTFVALNPVGVRLFNGHIQQGHIRVQSAAHYRGADPATLIWGYRLWQQRDQAQACWTGAAYQLVTQTDELQLRKGKRLLAHWWAKTPDMIDLPSAGLRIKLRSMD